MEPEVIESTPQFENYKEMKKSHLKAAAKDSGTATTQPKTETTTVPASDKSPKTPAESAEKPAESAPPADKSSAAPVSSAPKGETADKSDESGKEAQQPKSGEKKRDRTAKGRAQELLAEGRFEEAEQIIASAVSKKDREKFDADLKTEKERADRLDKELLELRTRKPAIEESKPAAEAAKPTEAAKPAEPAKFAELKPQPNLKAFMEKAPAEHPDKSYEELQDLYWASYGAEVEAWSDRRDAWRDTERSRQATAQAATERASAAQASRKAEQDVKITAAKAKYPTFEAEINAAMAAHPTLKNEGIEAAYGLAKDMGELLYALVKDNAAEYLRIAKMAPQDAFYEVARLAARLELQAETSSPAAPGDTAPVSTPAPAPPAPAAEAIPAVVEKPKPAVSKAPKPYVPPSGAGESTPTRPTSYKAYKPAATALRRA